MRGASFTATTKPSRRAVRSRRSPCRLRSAAGWWRWRRPTPMAGACGLAVCPRPPAPLPARARSAPPSQARFTAEKLAELKDVPGFAPTFLLDGKPPEVGATLKQAALAATLEHLAHAGLDDFYRGDVGREIAGDLDRVGSPVTRADL